MRPVRGSTPGSPDLGPATAATFPQLRQEIEALWLPDEDEENLVLHRIHEKYAPGSTEAYVPVTNLLDEIDLNSLSGPRIAPGASTT